MSGAINSWTLAGADGETIRGVTESPAGGVAPTAVVILAHGFTGHMEFGFMPALSGLLKERHGCSVIRFTFSHAGVTGGDGIRVDRPDLFERDTWGKQVFDLGVVFDWVRAEMGAGVPVVIAGHSRGGGVCLLLAGRRFVEGGAATPDGVVAIMAPDRPGSLSDEDCARLVADGSVGITAPITGQRLVIGAAFGQERLDDPAAFDVLGLCGSIGCPVLAVGGGVDRLVPAVCSRRIARACPRGEVVVIEGADHMVNVREPAGSGGGSAQVEELGDVMGGFIERLCAGGC